MAAPLTPSSAAERLMAIAFDFQNVLLDYVHTEPGEEPTSGQSLPERYTRAEAHALADEIQSLSHAFDNLPYDDDMPPMAESYIRAMIIMARTSDTFARPVRFGHDGEIDVNEYVYVDEVAGGLMDDPRRRPAPPDYRASVMLMFSAWTSPDTDRGAKVRAQARELYCDLEERDAALWDELCPAPVEP